MKEQHEYDISILTDLIDKAHTDIDEILSKNKKKPLTKTKK